MNKKNSKGINELVILLYRFSLPLAIFTLLRIIFYLMNQSLFPHVTATSFWNIICGGIRFDISALIYINSLFFILFLIPYPNKFTSKYRFVINAFYFIPNVIGIAANCIDIIYYRFILKRTTFDIIEGFKNEDNMGSLWSKFIVDYWYVTLIFVAFVAFFVFATLKVKPRVTPIKNKWLYSIFSLIMIAAVAGLSVAGIRGGFRHSTRPITLSNAAAYTNSPEESAIVLNTPFSIIRTIGKTNLKRLNFYTDSEVEKIYSPIHEADSVGVPNDKNVVIFIMESFSREFFGCFNRTLEGGTYKGYTPFLDSLAEHSLVFPNTFANGRKSIDAMPSVLTSIPSLSIPFIVSPYSSNSLDGLPRVLNSKGYSTAFFHGAPNGSMGFDGFAKIAGFQKYMGKTEYGNDADFDGIWGIWDDKFLQYYADEISDMKTPFMTALFSLSSHHPFKVPERFEGKFPKGKLPVEECIAYSDYSLKMFFEKARKQPWYNNTLFVITADHSSIPDHKEYETIVNSFAIPLIFYAPGDTTLKGVDYGLAQQIDIMPTIMTYLNINSPYCAYGNDLFNTSESERFILNYINGYQFMQGEHVLYFDGQNVTGVFNYKNDPELQNNLIGQYDYSKEESLMKAVIQQYNNRLIDNKLKAN